MSEETELKWDVDVTWRIELANSFGEVLFAKEGPCLSVEHQLCHWAPCLIDGDTIKITKVTKS